MTQGQARVSWVLTLSSVCSASYCVACQYSQCARVSANISGYVSPYVRVCQPICQGMSASISGCVSPSTDNRTASVSRCGRQWVRLSQSVCQGVSASVSRCVNPPTDDNTDYDDSSCKLCVISQLCDHNMVTLIHITVQLWANYINNTSMATII